MKWRTFAFAAIGMAIPSLCAAEFVYRSTMPDGQVLYSEAPQAGAKETHRIALPPGMTKAQALAMKPAAPPSKGSPRDARSGSLPR